MTKIIAVQFEGVCYSGDLNTVGKINVDLITELWVQHKKGNEIIVLTRYNHASEHENIYQWFLNYDIILDAINANTQTGLDIMESVGMGSNAIFAHEYITEDAFDSIYIDGDIFNMTEIADNRYDAFINGRKYIVDECVGKVIDTEVTPFESYTWECDPDKNVFCSKTMCGVIHSDGACYRTLNPAFAKEV